MRKPLAVPAQVPGRYSKDSPPGAWAAAMGAVMTPWKDLLHSVARFLSEAPLLPWNRGREDSRRRMARGLRLYCRQYQG
jgi:hypothetical protein